MYFIAPLQLPCSILGVYLDLSYRVLVDISSILGESLELSLESLRSIPFESLECFRGIL